MAGGSSQVAISVSKTQTKAPNGCFIMDLSQIETPQAAADNVCSLQEGDHLSNSVAEDGHSHASKAGECCIRPPSHLKRTLSTESTIRIHIYFVPSHPSPIAASYMPRDCIKFPDIVYDERP